VVPIVFASHWVYPSGPHRGDKPTRIAFGTAVSAAISSLYSNTDYYFNPLPKSAALRHNSHHV
jgi:hypothetical protein